MCIYPVEDWPYFSRYRKDAYYKYSKKLEPFNAVLEEVREKIKQKGPLSSIGLELNTKIDWSWSSTRLARAILESMYFWGELIIHHKVGTRKVYDFANKYIPDNLLSTCDPNTTLDEYYEWHVKRRIRAVGLLWKRPSDAWLGIYKMKSKERNGALTRLEDKGEIIATEVEGIKYPCYITKDDMFLLNKVLNDVDIEPQASFIAPLDNLLWDRKLIKELFGFEYVWEVYKPISERKHGYYVLPVLWRDRFIARFEPKFDKKTKKLRIINWWWESDITVCKKVEQALIEAFRYFLQYLGATDIVIEDNIKKEKNLLWLNKI